MESKTSVPGRAHAGSVVIEINVDKATLSGMSLAHLLLHRNHRRKNGGKNSSKGGSKGPRGNSNSGKRLQMSSSAVLYQTRGEIICLAFWCLEACAEQKRFDLS